MLWTNLLISQDWRTQLLSVSKVLAHSPLGQSRFTIPGRVSRSLITGWSLLILSLPGHTHFPTFEETVDSGPGNLAPPPSGFPDWDPSTHAAYTDSSCPYSAAEGFLTPDFYPPSDPGRSGPFPLGMEVNYRGDRRLRVP